MDAVIAELKRRMIRSTMTIVTVLLVVFLASVNIANYALMLREQGNALSRASGSIQTGGPGRDGGQQPLQDSEEGRASGSYFTVRAAQDGTILDMDLSRTPDVTKSELPALLNRVKAEFAPLVREETEGGTEAETSGEGISPPDGGTQGSSPGPLRQAPDDMTQPPDGPVSMESASGQTDGYLYHVLEEPEGTVLYVFLDIRSELSSCLRVVLLSILAGAIAWAAVLVITIRSSRKSVEPVAESMRRQREFISNAGHEIKTPLAVIVANVDVQQLHTGETKWLSNIRSQALRLSDLTKQMLTLSKMEEGGGNFLVPEEFDARTVLLDTLQLFREPAQLRGMEIVTDTAQSAPVRLPKEPYAQMLELLFDNAVKYGKENGAIRVCLKSEKKDIRITVENDCERVPDVPPGKLFERFYRAEESRSRESGGSGIGLSVVAATAQQFGGTASCRYLGTGGIEFELLLPKTFTRR